MDRHYKGIEFAEGITMSFADFKKEYESIHVFKNIPSDERDAALKEAHKIATKGNGHSKPAIDQSPKADPGQAE